MKKIFTPLLITISFSAFSQVRISQVYGAGGNASATYTADFVELFNPTAAPVSLTGYSIQYASATGTSWQKIDLPAATLVGGQYFLVQMSATGATGISLPTPDATASPVISMSGTAGKVALVNNTTALSGTQCPPPFIAAIVDYVGYGTTANCFEGTGPTPAPGSNANSLSRINNGCTDNNDNASDFTAGIALARNSASPLNPCGAAVATLVAGPNITNITTNTGTASAPQTFTLSGYNLTGFPGNISVTASANFEVSLTSGSGYATSINVPYTSASLAATTIYVRISAAAPQGALNGTVTCSGGGAAINAVVTISGGVYQNYYNTKANNGVNNVSTWSSTVNGAGASPLNFTDPYQSFNIVNQSNAGYSGVWDVTSTGNTSRVIVGDGVSTIVFTVFAGVDSLTSATRVDVLNAATLILQNNRRPFLNNLATGSTVNFEQPGLTTADTIKVPAISFYNLTLKDGIKILASGTITVRGTLVINNVINFNGAQSPFSTLNVFGDVQFINGTTFEPLPSGDNARITLAMNGNGTQTITGSTILLFRLQRDSTSSNSIINVNAANLTLGNAAGGGLRLNQGAATTTVMSMTTVGSQLNFIGGAVITPASTGKIHSSNISISIAKTGGTTNAGILRFVSGSFLSSFTINFDAAFTRDSVIVADSLIVRGLNLTKGKIVVNPGAVLDVSPDGVISTSANITGGSASSFVEGKLRRGGFLSAPTANFPVGKGNKYAPIDLGGVTPGGFTVEYFFNGYGNYTIDPVTLSTYPGYEISKKEYWIIENPASFPLDITFHYTDALSGIIDPTQVKIAHFDGVDWNDLGGTCAVTNTTTNGTVTVTGVTTFSPFTFSARISGVIPVKLSSFTALKLNSSVKLNWTTEQEMNSKEFIVERSVDGTTWSAIATITAAGNSNTKMNYGATDYAPVKGINFYRIRQVSLDGMFDYSVTKSVLFNTAYELLVTPNPATDLVNIYIDKKDNRSVNIQLLDATGKVVRNIISDNPHVQINTSGLGRGVYYVKVIDEKNVVTSKILLQ
ncbi:MAG: T9SS type A sorting domain-containing protein [Ferruginibacter sp.]